MQDGLSISFIFFYLLVKVGQCSFIGVKKNYHQTDTITQYKLHLLIFYRNLEELNLLLLVNNNSCALFNVLLKCTPAIFHNALVQENDAQLSLEDIMEQKNNGATWKAQKVINEEMRRSWKLTNFEILTSITDYVIWGGRLTEYIALFKSVPLFCKFFGQFFGKQPIIVISFYVTSIMQHIDD